MPFLLFFLLFGGCVGICDDISQAVERARCRLRIGILAETQLSSPQKDGMLQKALSYFRERNVDAVILAGDVTQDGALAQWRGAKGVWDGVFAHDGSAAPVPVVVTGERDGEKVYEGLTGRSYEPVFSLNVKGYTFIGANWKDAMGVDAWALKPILAKIDGTKPFFYVQNLIPYGTCCPKEGRADVFDGGKVAYMLSKFPNAVAICGRSHTPLADESAFWRGAFTCVNAGTFSYARMRGQDGAWRKNVFHGMVMSVYDTSIVFERFDFGCKPQTHSRFQEGVYVEKLGEDWRVELKGGPTARRETVAPQFWEDTKLMVLASEKVVSVRFPPVLAKHTGVRAYAYEVVAKTASGTVLSSCTTWSPGFCSSEEGETKPVTVNFPRESLPKGAVRFEVIPIDAFDRRGRAITGEVTL